MNTKTLENNILFRGMTADEIGQCLTGLRAQEKSYEKDSMIMHAGSLTDRMGLVLSGSVTIENNDVWGNVTILSHVSSGQFFAETYAMLPGEVMLVDVRANENCRILFLHIGTVLGAMHASSWKDKMIRNLLMISAQKNLTLSKRSFHTSPKSARSRILSYLNTVALQKQSNEFDIPFNRQQMADYLNLERTSMSKELGKMQKEGILTFHKNHFTLIRQDH